MAMGIDHRPKSQNVAYTILYLWHYAKLANNDWVGFSMILVVDCYKKGVAMRAVGFVLK